MLLEKLSELLSKSKWRKVVFIVLVIILFVIYFSVFFKNGMNYAGEFLVKEKTDGQITYKGDSVWGDMTITIIGDKNKSKNAQIIYNLPNNIYRQYTVTYEDSDNWYEGITEIKDESGNIIFEGSYTYRSLTNKDGSHYFDSGSHGVSIVSFNGIMQSPFNDDFEVSLTHVAMTAAFHNDQMLGDLKLMILGVLILFFVTIDFLEPLFFFSIRTVLWTQNAEPSDMYITFQKWSWNITPLLGITLLILSLFPEI